MENPNRTEKKNPRWYAVDCFWKSRKHEAREQEEQMTYYQNKVEKCNHGIDWQQEDMIRPAKLDKNV